MTHDYDDIINHPHHVSKRHPQMSMWNRAAQFAPFAALTGYEDAIRSASPLATKGTQVIGLPLATEGTQVIGLPLATKGTQECSAQENEISYEQKSNID